MTGGLAAALLATGAVLAAAGAASGARRWAAASRARGRLRDRTGPAVDPVPGWLRAAFERAGLGAEAEPLLSAWVGAITVAGLAALALPGARILVVVAALAGPGSLLLAGGRATRRRRAQLPEALDAIAAGLRGGLALPTALAGATSVGPPLGDELAGLVREVDAGRPLGDAVQRWQATRPDACTSLVAAALTVAADVGGPGARAVDGAAASLRERLGSEAEASALATQGRASAAVLTLAPLAFAVLLTSLDPAAARFLLGTPVGWICIGAGLALDAAGAWWMAHLVRRAR